MRALTLLQGVLNRSLDFMHRRRRKALWRGVEGLINGGKLWLTGLGRALPGTTCDKHRIKAADRLLGNRQLHSELPRLYAGLAAVLLRKTDCPVVAIDWTGVGPRHYAISAMLCHQGRALPFYTEVHPKKLVGNSKVERRFLERLAAVVPSRCTPIVVTDAGFYFAWYTAVLELGWHFVGRIRNQVLAKVDDNWVPAKSLYRRAKPRPQFLGTLLLCRKQPRAYRMILSKVRKSKGRKRHTLRGTIGQKTDDHRCMSRAREPWLLATSLRCASRTIVGLYALRMEIEETFRDLKNHRHGWSLEDVGCKSSKRIEVLLALAALASAVIHLVGLSAERQNLHYQFQGNTKRNRRVLSLFVLGSFVIARGTAISSQTLRRALDELRSRLSEISPFK